jgi:maltose/moltooligosaccharide transporter
MEKRRLSFWEIWNMSFGFLGIQMGFAYKMQMQTVFFKFLAPMFTNLSWFWIIAPLMGLIVQPIIGHYSDNTWSIWKKKTLFLTGALLASIGLVLMPQQKSLLLYACFMGWCWNANDYGCFIQHCNGAI